VFQCADHGLAYGRGFKSIWRETAEIDLKGGQTQGLELPGLVVIAER
jgi:hypothetical protein